MTDRVSLGGLYFGGLSYPLGRVRCGGRPGLAWQNALVSVQGNFVDLGLDSVPGLKYSVFRPKTPDCWESLAKTIEDCAIVYGHACSSPYCW